jgi:hypothetical protein
VPSFSDSRIGEASGFARSITTPSMLWTINDENTKPQVFGVDSASGKTEATFSWKKATITDPEAICVDPQARIWYADIGDNSAVRSKVQLLVRGEPGPGDHGNLTFTRYWLDYPGGPRNAESFLINPITGDRYVISKEATSKLYKLPDVLQTGKAVNRLTLVASTFGAEVSDAAFTPDGRFVLSRRKDENTTVYVHETTGWTQADTITVPSQVKPEGITVAADQMSFWISSEGRFAPFHNVPMPSAYQPLAPTSPAPPPPHASPPSPTPPKPATPCG